MRFFKHLAARPPKFRRTRDWKSFVFKQDGYRLSGNAVMVNRLGLTNRFSLSCPYAGTVKRVMLERSRERQLGVDALRFRHRGVRERRPEPPRFLFLK